jgi:hypothetical protein
MSRCVDADDLIDVNNLHARTSDESASAGISLSLTGEQLTEERLLKSICRRALGTGIRFKVHRSIQKKSTSMYSKLLHASA